LTADRRRPAIGADDETTPHLVLDVIELVADARRRTRRDRHVAHTTQELHPG
jgi:hypothetical protein